MSILSDIIVLPIIKALGLFFEISFTEPLKNPLENPLKIRENFGKPRNRSKYLYRLLVEKDLD